LCHEKEGSPMRRMTVLATVCTLLVFGMMLTVRADQISVSETGDQIDVVLRDADINAVLAALFNTTHQQFRVEAGVTGRIARLETHGTFEAVLNAILDGNHCSYQKSAVGDGISLYRIAGPPSTTPTTGGATTTGGTGFPAMAPPSDSLSPVAGGGTKSTSSGDFSNPGFSLSFPTKSSTDSKTGDSSKTATDASSNEPSVIRLVKVNNVDLPTICSALGGSVVVLFNNQKSMSSGGIGTSGISGYNNTGTTGTTGITSTTGTTTTATTAYPTTMATPVVTNTVPVH